MEALELLRIGGFPIVLIGLIVVVERLRATVDSLKEAVKDDRDARERSEESIRAYIRDELVKLNAELEEFKQRITWKDTCQQKHGEIERRFGRLEKWANGGLGKQHT